MRAKEFVFEGRTGSLQPDVAAALPATYVLPQLRNQDPYLQYRFSVAMASVKGKAEREKDHAPSFSPQSVWGENQIVVSFDKNIEKWIDLALKEMGLSEKRLISTPKSEEAKDVDKSSPIKPFKGYN